MTAPIQLLLAFLALLVAARTRLTMTVHGAAVSVPVLWLVAAAVVLALAAAVLYLARAAIRDGGFWRLRPRAVTA
jgi:hypothetical protein